MNSPDILIGLQWGDEGKGKIVDALAADYDYIVRYQGGSNAGHTVYINGTKHVLHSIPTGVLRENVKSIITHGCPVNPEELVREIKTVEKAGNNLRGRLFISSDCPVTLRRHLLEDEKNKTEFGSTGKGIGPTFVDKYNRRGIRLRQVLRDYPELKPYVTDVTNILRGEVEIGDKGYSPGAKILFEGAQGAMLDIDFGTYPDVTSSPCSALYVPQASGLPLATFKDSSIIGVMKAYTTRIGTGPFPSEFPNKAVQDHWREVAQEFGATTGRPRRIGWLDIPQLKYACKINGVTSLAITRIDTLAEFADNLVVEEYLSKDGIKTTYHDNPHDLRLRQLRSIDPIEVLEAKNHGVIGDTILDFVRYVQDQLDIPVSMIGVGPNRKDIVYL